jgi:hypothetical protein
MPRQGVLAVRYFLGKEKTEMKKDLRHLWYASVFFAAVCLPSISFGVVVTVELGNPLDTNPDPYIVDIQMLEITEHSEIVLLVENIEDPMRYKEWELTVWVPQAYAPLAKLDILDYQYGGSTLNIYDVPMALDSTAVSIPGYVAFYADTKEAAWYQYGTQPVGAEWGRVDIGNPEWASFHFDPGTPENTPVFISVYDVCIPEPTTMILLTLGGLLLRKRTA